MIRYMCSNICDQRYISDICDQSYISDIYDVRSEISDMCVISFIVVVSGRPAVELEASFLGGPAAAAV